MKKTVVFSLIIMFALSANLFSQSIKLRDYVNTKDVKDYKQNLKESEIYNDESKYIVHTFELLSNNQLIDKGKIYRQFYKKGNYESLYSVSDKKLFQVSYWSDPTALITANINKSEYCVEKNINNILFPMVIRGYAKILKSGNVEKKFKDIKFILTKDKNYKSNEKNMTKFNVTSEPKVIEGNIETMNGMIVVKGDLTIDNDLAKRSGLKLIFSHSDLPNMVKIQLKFDCLYFDAKKPANFMEMGIDEIISKYQKIECD